jgi:hypothetical protein
MLQITLYIKCHKIVSVLVRYFYQNIYYGRFTVISAVTYILVNYMLRSRTHHDIRFLDNMDIDIAVRLDQWLGDFSRKLARTVWEIEWNVGAALESFVFSGTVRRMALMTSYYFMLFFWKWPLHCHIWRRIWFGFGYPNKEILKESSL